MRPPPATHLYSRTSCCLCTPYSRLLTKRVSQEWEIRRLQGTGKAGAVRVLEEVPKIPA